MLGFLRRRRKLPADQRPPLGNDERILAWADSASALGDVPSSQDDPVSLQGRPSRSLGGFASARGDVLAAQATAPGTGTAASTARPTGDAGPAGGDVTGPTRFVVATNYGLWLPGRPRLAWHEVHKAAWAARELRITAAEVAEERPQYAVLVDQPVVSYLLLEPGDLPDQVRSRVTKSVAYTSYHPLPDGGGVRIAARRVSGVDGLRWTVRYDTGTAADSAVVVRTTDELVGQLLELNAPPG